jgi:hypothetical protein
VRRLILLCAVVVAFQSSPAAAQQSLGDEFFGRKTIALSGPQNSVQATGFIVPDGSGKYYGGRLEVTADLSSSCEYDLDRQLSFYDLADGNVGEENLTWVLNPMASSGCSLDSSYVDVTRIELSTDGSDRVTVTDADLGGTLQTGSGSYQ